MNEDLGMMMSRFHWQNSCDNTMAVPHVLLDVTNCQVIPDLDRHVSKFSDTCGLTRCNNKMHAISRNNMHRGFRSNTGTVWISTRGGTRLEWDGMWGLEWGLESPNFYSYIKVSRRSIIKAL